MRHNTATGYTCDLCGAVRHKPVWSLDFSSHPGPFHLWQCRQCGVVFNWPRLSTDAIHAQYDADYYVFTLPPQQRWGRACQLYLDHLLPLEKESAGNRLLEIGCARGDLLSLAHHRGWQVEGIEISPSTAASAQAESGLAIRAGTLEEHANEIGTFDVVIATDVIEHVPSPTRFLRAIRQVLAPGGRAIIETPNWGGWWRRLAGRRWLGLNRFHVFLFNSPCLMRLMQQCGFRECSASSDTHMAYVLWGERPEVTRFTAWLPKPLQWRAQRILNQATPHSMATDLHGDPPTALDAALARIESASHTRILPQRRPGCLTHDNLAVVGQV